jgi:methyl coenzyme M reductase gamma subunit
MSIVEKKAGRPKGSGNVSYYKWKVMLFDDKTKSFKEGKYTSVNHINQELNLDKPLNSDYVRRIMTRYRADPNMRNKENSFLARYGHIQIEKIYEPVH